MTKKKNTIYPRYAVTISPLKGAVTPVQLADLFHAYVLRVKSTKYAYVIELGKQKDHPHLHFLMDYPSAKRRDTLSTSIKTFFYKYIDQPPSPHFCVVKPAYNPIYFLSEYMNKEDDVINHGYQLDILKHEAKSDRRKYMAMGSNLKPLTRTNIIQVYTEFYNLIWIDGIRQEPHYLFQEFAKWCQSNDFNASFIIWNKRQVYDVVLFSQGEDIDLN